MYRMDLLAFSVKLAPTGVAWLHLWSNCHHHTGKRHSAFHRSDSDISEWHLYMSAYFCSFSSVLIIHKSSFWISRTERVRAPPHSDTAHCSPPFPLTAQDVGNVETPCESWQRQDGPSERLLLAHSSLNSLL